MVPHVAALSSSQQKHAHTNRCPFLHEAHVKAAHAQAITAQCFMCQNASRITMSDCAFVDVCPNFAVNPLTMISLSTVP